jgi:hypothetical protein
VLHTRTPFFQSSGDEVARVNINSLHSGLFRPSGHDDRMLSPDGDFLYLGAGTPSPIAMFENENNIPIPFGTSAPFSPSLLPVHLKDMEAPPLKSVPGCGQVCRAPKHANFAGR